MITAYGSGGRLGSQSPVPAGIRPARPAARQVTMASYYLYFRYWLGYAQAFPFERFNGLPDDRIACALDEYARSWIEDHPEEWGQRDKEQMARAALQPSLPDPQNPGPFAKGKVPLGQLIYDVGLTAGWIERLPPAHCCTPSNRFFFHIVQRESLACCAPQELQTRFAFELQNLRFGYLPTSVFDLAEKASVELGIRDLVEGPIDAESVTAILDRPHRELVARIKTVVDALEATLIDIEATPGDQHTGLGASLAGAAVEGWMERRARQNPVEPAHSSDREHRRRAQASEADHEPTHESGGQGTDAESGHDIPSGLRPTLSGDSAQRADRAHKELSAYSQEWVRRPSLEPKFGIPPTSVDQDFRSYGSAQDRVGGGQSMDPVQFRTAYLKEFVLKRWSPRCGPKEPSST